MWQWSRRAVIVCKNHEPHGQDIDHVESEATQNNLQGVCGYASFIGMAVKTALIQIWKARSCRLIISKKAAHAPRNSF